MAHSCVDAVCCIPACTGKSWGNYFRFADHSSNWKNGDEDLPFLEAGSFRLNRCSAGVTSPFWIRFAQMPTYTISSLWRYPVKSMAGERLEVANLGWYGIEGDRHLAFRKRLLHIFARLTGKICLFLGEDLARQVARRYGAPVEMTQLRHGIFDEATISVIASDTVLEVGRLAGRTLDVRQFRPNVLVHLLRSVPFQEDEWLGGVLCFGEGTTPPSSP